jgi:hypothetical protein
MVGSGAMLGLPEPEQHDELTGVVGGVLGDVVHEGGAAHGKAFAPDEAGLLQGFWLCAAELLLELPEGCLQLLQELLLAAAAGEPVLCLSLIHI